MPSAPVTLLEDPERVRLALSPLRRQLLERLRQPASAAQLAVELELGRQLVNYHLRVLEDAGFVELVEERPRRGCVERILRARSDAFVVDPAVMGARDSGAAAQDRFAATHLIDAASGIVREVARMQSDADVQGARLLTFTIEAEVSFGSPEDLERFTTELADVVARTASAHRARRGGRRYRIVVGGHPAPNPARRKKP